MYKVEFARISLQSDKWLVGSRSSEHRLRSQWLPQSEWQLDDREHFEILLPDWRADDPNAREEVWIPVRK